LQHNLIAIVDEAEGAVNHTATVEALKDHGGLYVAAVFRTHQEIAGSQQLPVM